MVIDTIQDWDLDDMNENYSPAVWQFAMENMWAYAMCRWFSSSTGDVS